MPLLAGHPASVACQICPVVEEWPLDFNGDDFAEVVQKRVCHISSSNPRQIEQIVILSSERKPINYRDNSQNNLQIIEFMRADFNDDNFDEFVIVEKDFYTNNDYVTVLAYNFEKQAVAEIEQYSYQELINEKLRAGENVVQEEFVNLNNFGFITKLHTSTGRTFKLLYSYAENASNPYQQNTNTEASSTDGMYDVAILGQETPNLSNANQNKYINGKAFYPVLMK